MAERIAKFLSAAGVCSRRDAERLIIEGRVVVNGVVLSTPATLVSHDDTIHVDGKAVKSKSHQPARLWLYHKPAGLVTTHRDERGRSTVFDQLPAHLPRVVSVGRLDLDSEGLLLLTTSGALARAMELPKNAQTRTYRVRIRGTPMETHLAQLERGVKVEGVQYQPIDVMLDSQKTEGRNRWLTLTLREGKNREIRRIFEQFDLPVSRLIRVGYGAFELGKLKPGEVKEVPKATVQQLLQQWGVK
jgi:23S rRNA pseudouridine2605 synthase